MNIDTAIQFLTDLKLELSLSPETVTINLQFLRNKKQQQNFYHKFIYEHALTFLSNKTTEDQLFIQCFVIAWYLLVVSRLTTLCPRT